MDQGLKHLLDESLAGSDFQKINIALRSGEDTAVFSATLSERAYLLSSLNKQILYIANDRQSALTAFEAFGYYFGDKELFVIKEREDNLLYRGSTHDREASNTIEALCALKNKSAKCVIITREALLQYYRKPSDLISFRIEKNGEYDFSELSLLLAGGGFKRSDVVENIGEFSFNGDILTIFPNNYANPLRISFFDTIVEYIAEYDIDTLQKLSSYDYVDILPSVEFVIEPAALDKARKDAKVMKGDARQRACEILAEIAFHYEADNNAVQAQWLRPYCGGLSSIFDYLDDKSVIAIDEGATFIDKLKLYYNDFINRHLTLYECGDVLPMHVRNLMPAENLAEYLNGRTKVIFSSITNINKYFTPKRNFNLNSAPPPNYYMNFKSFYADVKSYNIRGMLTVICCGDAHTAESIKNSLYDEGIFSELQYNIALKKSGVIVTPSFLPYGFVCNKSKLAVIGRNQLIRKKDKPISKRKRRMFVMPKCGDYVVHEIHGIGLCTGTETITDRGISKEYVVLQYYGNNKLYVPVDQMDRLQRYSGSDVAPKLSKIGGKDWEKITDKVKAAVREMAFSLVELYKKRSRTRGFKYSADTNLQKEFEDCFEYQETEDQLRAAAEIKSDMESGIVMDRLLCGDVGYGKTEVALRAIFKTITDGKQAAILAPTTILAKQHYNTALSRFDGFGAEIALLTRFQSADEIKKAMNGIKSGKVNLVIATHKLLSDKLEFKDLGLLVLDEEQRFGVEHKEKLKVNINNVNVLTLSATPIPRTLNMALTGIRDISVLETPPRERLAIATYVTEMSDALLTDAITRELKRDGQVFVLYNRVETIDSVASRITDLVPEAKVVVGHGQMSNAALEKVINTFYTGEANVFVATTIIENGVDLPNANTIIVYDADRLGLSAMYQLRGRVGRSNRQAYAYFTTPPRKSVTPDAMKRLNAVMDYTEFGSGYKIAMRDLEIRGAGNVLGKEQSGHIVKVGYDMYCKLLEEAVEEINGDSAEKTGEVEMAVEANAYLDDKYIGNIDEKLRVFKEIAEVATVTERDALIEKLSVNYGNPDKSLVNLVEIALIKNLAAAAGAVKVTIDSKVAAIAFRSNVFSNEAVINAVSAEPDKCALSIENAPKLVFNAKGLSIEQKMSVVKNFLLNVAKSI